MPADGTHLEGVPELVIEVRSPSTWRYDTTVKFRTYEATGVAELWMVDTASHTILVYRRSTQSSDTFDLAFELDTEKVLVSPLLEGFTLNIGSLFGP